MLDLDRIRAVKQSVAAQLHAIPGVHAVGVGAKVVGGKRTDELSITVFVVKKKRPEELAEAEIVPSEMQGVKTDVVEKPPGRLRSADPHSVTATVTPLPPDQGSSGGIVTLAGKAVPDNGLFVVLDLVVQHLDHTPRNRTAFAEADGAETLKQLASKLGLSVNQINGAEADVDSATPLQVTITATPDFTVTITRAYVVVADGTKYFKDYVRGGITIEAGATDAGIGTLGCLATTDPSEEHPEGLVVGLTNFHVVCPTKDGSTNLVADRADDRMSVEFHVEDGPGVNSGTVVLFLVIADAEPRNLLFSAFYTTAPHDTATEVVSGILAAATGLPAGVTVSQTAGNSSSITLTGPVTLSCLTFGPPTADPKANLKARVSKPTPSSNAITFDGQVSGEDYGIYVKINPGGLKFTFGSFLNPKKDTSPNDVATAVSAAINGLPADLRGAVTASPSGNAVNLNNVEHAECRVVGDIRVGQPDDDFGSTCSHCCSHRIGRIVDAQVHSDVALIQLDAKLQYKLQIQDIPGAIKANPAGLQVGLQVKKRGRTSGRLDSTTTGTVRYLEVSSDIEENNGLVRLFEHAFIIESDSGDVFSLPGDSGSAVLSSADNTLVGLLFGGSDPDAMGMELAPLLAAFPKLQLSFLPAPGDDVNTVQTVPEPFALQAVGAEALGLPPSPQLTFAGGKLWQKLDEAETEIRQTAPGREYADVVRRHMDEGFALVNHNRRVATVWRRSSGPEILEALARMIQVRNERLPAEVNGKPLGECLSRIQRILARYASPAFSADLNRYATQLAGFSQMTYLEVLAAFQAEATS
jgi:hypothetical protein